MKKSMICILAAVALLLISSSHAGVPALINYQGKLTDQYGGNGVRLDILDIWYNP